MLSIVKKTQWRRAATIPRQNYGYTLAMERTSPRLRKSVIIAVAISVITIIAICLFTMNRSTWSIVNQMSPFLFLVVLGLMATRWLVTCVRCDLLIRAAGYRMPFGRVVKAVLSGGFAGAVTPYHAAGIPVQIVFLANYGLGGGHATAVVTTGAALSVLLFIFTFPVILVISAAYIHVGLGFRTLLVSAGIIGFFFFLLVAYSMKEPERIAPVLRRYSPAFLRERPGFERSLGKFTQGIDNFSESLRSILKAPPGLLALIVLMTVMFWAAGMLVAPFTLWGLGYPGQFWEGLLGQLVVSFILPFVPLPGESGVAEAAFAGVFSLFIPSHMVGIMTLAWRFFMFYLVVAVLGTVFVVSLRDTNRGVMFEVEAIGDERVLPDEARLLP